MSTTTVDARNLKCPEPVIRARAALAAPGADAVVVLVDTTDTAQNVALTAEALGWKAEVLPGDAGFEVHLERGPERPEATTQPAMPKVVAGKPSAVFLLASDKVGEGDPQLGAVLMRAAVKTLRDLPFKPHAVVFMNSGVRLACEGSPVLDDLRQLSGEGVTLLACGTCLDFYQLKDALRAGRVSNMFEILNTLASADPMVRL
jgi:selenium metabolism protein YedF